MDCYAIHGRDIITIRKLFNNVYKCYFIIYYIQLILFSILQPIIVSNHSITRLELGYLNGYISIKCLFKIIVHIFQSYAFETFMKQDMKDQKKNQICQSLFLDS